MIADIFEAVAASAVLAGVEQQLGGEFLDVQSVAPRVVWVPTRDRIKSGRIQAGLAIGDKSKPASIATRLAGVKCRCWAKADTAGNVADSVAEVRACEELARKLIVAVEGACYGSYICEDLVWLDQDGAPLVQYGRAVDVNFVFEVPVYRTQDEEAIATAQVEAIEGTGAFALAGEAEEVVVGPQLLEPLSVAVTPATPALDAGDTQHLTATATYSDGVDRDVSGDATWASSVPAVATVSATGLLTGVRAGTALVSASIFGIDSPPQLVTVS